MRRTPRRLWLTLFTLAAFAFLVSLGVWQLRRLAWKEDLLARVAAAQTSEPRSLSLVLAANGDFGFARVSAVCPALESAPFAELYAVVDGRAGWRLISACPLSGAPFGSILVDRGFVADTTTWRPSQSGNTGPLPITGVLQSPAAAAFGAARDDPARRRFFTRAVQPIAAALNAEAPAPVFLMAETRTASDPALRPIATPPDLPNRHLGYAVTWFGLAAALIGVYAAVLIGDSGRGRAGPVPG